MASSTRSMVMSEPIRGSPVRDPLVLRLASRNVNVRVASDRDYMTIAQRGKLAKEKRVQLEEKIYDKLAFVDEGPGSEEHAKLKRDLGIVTTDIMNMLDGGTSNRLEKSLAFVTRMLKQRIKKVGDEAYPSLKLVLDIEKTRRTSAARAGRYRHGAINIDGFTFTTQEQNRLVKYFSEKPWDKVAENRVLEGRGVGNVVIVNDNIRSLFPRKSDEQITLDIKRIAAKSAFTAADFTAGLNDSFFPDARMPENFEFSQRIERKFQAINQIENPIANFRLITKDLRAIHKTNIGLVNKRLTQKRKEYEKKGWSTNLLQQSEFTLSESLDIMEDE